MAGQSVTRLPAAARAQVKPGPKAVISVRSGGRARSAVRARTAPSERSCCHGREAPRARGRARPRQAKRGLDRLDHLDPARVAAEAVDGARVESDSAQDLVDGLREFASMNGGMARSNTTASPGSSTRQPMIRACRAKLLARARFVASPSPPAGPPPRRRRRRTRRSRPLPRDRRCRGGSRSSRSRSSRTASACPARPRRGGRRSQGR